MKRLEAYIVTLLALTAAACGGDSPDPVGLPGSTVATVAITPNGGTIAPQQTLQLTATPRDAQGGTVAGASVTWSSSASSVATVSGSGLVTGVGPGEATITATSGGRGGDVVVSVLELEEAPEIGALAPAAIPADAGDFELAVEGTGFSPLLSRPLERGGAADYVRVPDPPGRGDPGGRRGQHRDGGRERRQGWHRERIAGVRHRTACPWRDAERFRYPHVRGDGGWRRPVLGRES